MISAWEELTRDEDQRVWDLFDVDFSFRPSTHPQDWPGIKEPTPSLTYDIHRYDDDDAKAPKLWENMEAMMLAAFRVCCPPHAELYALDWQHQCYRFYPHRQLPDQSEAWRVMAIPYGDYSIFLSTDLTYGIFGHPWEETMCVFGEVLLQAFERGQPAHFSKLVRWT